LAGLRPPIDSARTLVAVRAARTSPCRAKEKPRRWEPPGRRVALRVVSAR
jgi:hypothetical protein